MTESCSSANSADATKAATLAVVDALEAAACGDEVAARLALIECAERWGWPVLAAKLTTAAFALAHDAGLSRADDRAIVAMEPQLLAVVPWIEPGELSDVPAMLDEWRDRTAPPEPRPVADVWILLALSTFLVDRLGYPAAVVA